MRDTHPFTHLTIKTDYTGDIVCEISRHGQGVKQEYRQYWPSSKSLERIEFILNKDPYLDISLDEGIKLVSIHRKYDVYEQEYETWPK